MTDKELLELAAIAAGLNAKYIERVRDYDSPHYGGEAMQAGGCSADTWNPLASDGDALRLAFKLGISIDLTDSEEVRAIDRCGRHWTEFADEPCAVRRAIVNIAAEIGKAMQEKH